MGVTVHLHRGARTDLLAEGLAALLAVPTTDPFATEIVVVPARGVERWLTQRLAHRLGARAGADDGVCAGVRFLSPNSLVTLLLGTDRDDPWLPDHLVWPLLATIDEFLDEPWAAQLARHVGHGDPSPRGRVRAGRRYSVAHRLAGLFHSYAVQRPALLASWEGASGEPGRPAWQDGTGGPLDDDLAWQPLLWRALVARLGGPTPAQRHTETIARLRAGDPGLDLPDRLSLFGHTRLARTEIELLGVLGERREVHLWLPHPSPALWDKLIHDTNVGPVPRADDDSVTRADHPLLASLGRDLRELQRGLAPARAVSAPVATADPAAATWLGSLQADLGADRPPSPETVTGRAAAVGDGSIQVHACHGPARQVEVLREVLLGLLADDPSLEPRDILVMCPDIESYAPLVQAAFGLADVPLGGSHPAHTLRVQLADRALTSTNPLTAVAARLVELGGGRITASELLDLAATEPVRRRFGFDEDDLEQFGRWVEQAGVRWGLDESHRAAYGLGGLAANTWRTGLDRLLLGVARAEGPGHWSAGVLPLDDVDSGAIDLVGRVVEFVDRVEDVRTRLLAATGAADWMTVLGDGVAGLTDVPHTEAWQRAELDRELALVGAAAGSTLPLGLSDVRALLLHRLGGRPTRANFRTGSLTVCTMVPMRSVPHRVVALLGLDDGIFPRGNAIDGDDVLARRPMTGERDPRSEDRQLLLDAICAARETLVVTYSGADAHTGAPRPPAVPLGELIDAARAAVGVPGGRDEPVRRHPLQPFDPSALGGDGGPPFSFDPHALAAARAARAARPGTGRRLVIPGPLAPAPPGDLPLPDLERFLANPARAFLAARLDVGTPLDETETADEIPIELDHLERWALGERLLHDRLAGTSVPQVQLAERMRGQLPPAGLGDRLLREIGPTVDAIAGEAFTVLRPTGRADDTRADVDAAGAVDITVDLGARLLTGTVGRVGGSGFVLTTYSKISARHRLRVWLMLLALTAGAPPPAEGWTAHAIGRGRGGGASHVRLGPVPADLATAVLRDLAAVYDRGMREPIPFSPKTSYAYAETMWRSSRKHETPALHRARGEWLGDRFDGENADAAIRTLYGPRPPLDVLCGAAGTDERWAGGPAYESAIATRLGHYAMRVWAPALAAEVWRG